MSRSSITRFFAILFLTTFSLSAFAQQESEEPTIDDKINDFMEPITSAIWDVIFFSPKFGENTKIVTDKNNPESLIDKDSNPINFVHSSSSTDSDLIFDAVASNDGLVVKYEQVLDEGETKSYAKELAWGESFKVFDDQEYEATFEKSNSFTPGSYHITHLDHRIPFVLIWLIVGALIFTFWMRFVNIRAFKHALDVVRGKFDDPNDKGDVSHFQALTAALSGTVGVGNIAGVAAAVSLGGPGATFWMIMAGLLGMSSKFVECTLGVKYRKYNADGSVSGGPMYYLKNGLAKQGKGKLGMILAGLFAIACVGGSFGGGNMVQINQATLQLIDVTGGESSFFYGKGYLFGMGMAVLVAIIIIGGIKSIAKVTDKVVPLMVAVYVGAALIVIFSNLGAVPEAFGKIFGGAFTAKGMYGGMLGVLIVGFQRAAFSNEAGIGSASIAHSAAKTDEPVSEGIVALLEPFIDTVVICTMTALVIVISGYGDVGQIDAYKQAAGDDLQAIQLTSSAFANTISWFPTVLAVCVILFALSTMISWSYYGLKSWTYLFGESKPVVITYKAIFCLLVVVGSAISATQVFRFGDAMIFAMCFPNILGLYFLAPEIKKDLQSYLARVKSGEIKRYN